jgi:hypothetical protein
MTTQIGYLRNWHSPIEMGFTPSKNCAGPGLTEYHHVDGRRWLLGSTYSYDPAAKAGFFVAVYEC